LGDPVGRYDIPFYHREATRANLYKRWFNSYPLRDELTLQDEEIHFDNIIVYTGMILRNDHPDYQNLLQTYKEFVRRAESLYHVEPK